MKEEEGFLKEMKSPTELRRVLEFEVPRARVEREIQDIIDGIRKEVSLPGFRKGKAPADVIRARFAKTARKEAVEKLIPEAYRHALEKESLRPVLPAEIGDVEYGVEGPLRFRVEIEVFPQVKVGQYKGVKAKRSARPLDDADIDREIDALRERFARFQEVERPAEAEDTVIADYWRMGADGKPLRDSKVSNYPFDLRAPGLLGEFKEALAGVKAGDRKTVAVTYPEDFTQVEMRGKQVVFNVDVKKIEERRLPDLNSDFAKLLGLDSVDEVRTKVEEGLKKARDEEAETKLRRDILNQIIEASDFEVPEGLVNMGLDSIMKSYAGGQETEDAASRERLRATREQLRPLAVNLVKEQFVIDDIAEREKIAVSEAEIEEIIKSIADRSGLPLEEARRRASESEEMDRWRRDLLKNKVLDFLVQNAEVEE
jgi:trigger factor